MRSSPGGDIPDLYPAIARYIGIGFACAVERYRRHLRVAA